MPLHCWADDHWSPRVPIILSAFGQAPAPGVRPQGWIIDTGFTGEAFLWRHHLEDSGIDFNGAKEHRITLGWSASGEKKTAWSCKGHLWLVSNVPGRKNYRLRLYKGIACTAERAAAPDPDR